MCIQMTRSILPIKTTVSIAIDVTDSSLDHRETLCSISACTRPNGQPESQVTKRIPDLAAEIDRPRIPSSESEILGYIGGRNRSRRQENSGFLPWPTSLRDLEGAETINARALLARIC